MVKLNSESFYSLCNHCPNEDTEHFSHSRNYLYMYMCMCKFISIFTFIFSLAAIKYHRLGALQTKHLIFHSSEG